MPPPVLERLRKISLALPETHEVPAWGTATFRIKQGKIFAMYAAADTHAGKGRNGVWIKATSTNQQFMLEYAPTRFFFPPYVGKEGWIGVWLDGKTDWTELAELLADGWRLIAPKKIAALIDGPPPVTEAARRRAVKTPRKPATKAKTAKKAAKPVRRRSP